VNGAALSSLGYTPEWYNRDYTEGNSGSFLYDYQVGNSFFKLCEVTKELGKNSTAINFHDAVKAGVDCKNMNLYKCVSFCLVSDSSECKSIFFFEGPMDPTLRVPRYLCTQMRPSLEDKRYDGQLFFKNDTWTKDLKNFKCPIDACNSCTHETSGNVSACELREFLKTIGDDKDKLFPLVKLAGSKVVFMDHLGTNRSAAIADIQSKFHS
jgi:hypothetical protein